MLSRQEELKERARLLLEQARRDAALKASNKSNPSSAASAANRICDVSLPGFIGRCHVLTERVLRCFAEGGASFLFPAFEPGLPGLTVLEQLIE